MTRRVSFLPLVRVGLALLAVVFAFVAVTRFLASSHESAPAGSPPTQSPTPPAALTRDQQSAQDWRAAQKRADDRAAASKPR